MSPLHRMERGIRGVSFGKKKIISDVFHKPFLKN
jgi:hypothetical protein